MIEYGFGGFKLLGCVGCRDLKDVGVDWDWEWDWEQWMDGEKKKKKEEEDEGEECSSSNKRHPFYTFFHGPSPAATRGRGPVIQTSKGDKAGRCYSSRTEGEERRGGGGHGGERPARPGES